jgi:hypothetical protein
MKNTKNFSLATIAPSWLINNSGKKFSHYNKKSKPNHKIKTNSSNNLSKSKNKSRVSRKPNNWQMLIISFLLLSLNRKFFYYPKNSKDSKNGNSILRNQVSEITNNSSGSILTFWIKIIAFRIKLYQKLHPKIFLK